MKKIESTRRDPAFNLAFEEYMARNTGSVEVLIVWRDSPAVVCGRFQNVFRETDVIAARERGVPVLRRITGGGTVYHDEGNVNVSYITRKGPDGIDTLLLPEKLAAALGRIGIPAEVGGGSDVTAGGYKISGSARAAVGDREIHHATLLFDTDLDALRSLTSSVSGDAFVSGGIASRKSPVANISAFLPGTSTDEFVGAVKAALGGAYGWQTEDGFDLFAVSDLAREYTSDDRTYGENPKFAFSGTCETARGALTLSYESGKGAITAVRAEGAFAEQINKLAGAPLAPGATHRALTEAGVAEPDAVLLERFILTGKT